MSQEHKSSAAADSRLVDRRGFLRVAGASALSLALSPQIAWSKPAARRPNILLCVPDDWGWPEAGAYGGTVVKTPTFDRVAREGVLFERGFCSSPTCTAARNAMLTGQQFYRLGEGANLHSALDVSYPNFMYLLKDAGYEIGHWRKAWGPGDWKAGGYKEHPAGPQMSYDKFMKQRSPDKPFCFWFGGYDPHRPYEKGSGKASGMDLSRIRVPEFLPDVETTRSDLADYFFEVERWDHDVSQGLELLEQSGELENTIVVMTSDHGMGFPHCKANLYDWGVRVPLAIRWGKGVKSPGRRVKAFASTTDLAPTFLEACGVAIPKVMTGQSLMPLLQGDDARTKKQKREWIVTGRERHAAAQKMPSLDGYPSRALRTDEYLYIMNLKPNRWPVGVPEGATHPIGSFADCDNGPTKSFIINHRDDPRYRRYYEWCFARRPAQELYDMRTDPDQVHNVANDPAYQAVALRLRKQLTAYLHDTDDPRFTDQPVKFDDYPYRDPRIMRRVKAWEKAHPVDDVGE